MNAATIPHTAVQAKVVQARNVSKVFFLDSQYRPGPNVFEMHRVVTFHPGDMTTFVPGNFQRH